MKVSHRTKIRFDELPADYTGLCGILLPRSIHTKVEYAAVIEVADAMAVHEPDFTRDQEDYFDLLCTLIESWDRVHASKTTVTPLQILQHLCEEHQLSGADLSRLLGASAKLGSMILRGERSITADHARTLGRHFGLSAGVFIE